MDHFIRSIAGILRFLLYAKYNDFNFVHWIYGMQEFNTFLHFYSGEYRAIYKQEIVHIVEYRILLPDILLSKWWYLNLTSQILIVLLNTKKWDLDHLDWDQYLYFKIIYNILCMQWRGRSGVKWCREIIFVLVPAPLHISSMWRCSLLAVLVVLVVVMPVLFTGSSLTPRSAVYTSGHTGEQSQSALQQYWWHFLHWRLERRKYLARHWYCTVWSALTTFFFHK